MIFFFSVVSKLLTSRAAPFVKSKRLTRNASSLKSKLIYLPTGKNKAGPIYFSEK